MRRVDYPLDVGILANCQKTDLFDATLEGMLDVPNA